MTLYRLLARGDRARIVHTVISLSDIGSVGALIQKLDIKVYALNIKSPAYFLFSIPGLVRLVKQHHPDVIQGWMNHGNLATSIVAYLIKPCVPVVWNIRQSLYDIRKEKLQTRLLMRLGQYLKTFPEKIIYNSSISAKQHAKYGYSREKTIIIPNGIDCRVFRPNSKFRKKIRNELSLSDDKIVIGHIARFHPMKDHRNFVKAAALLATKHPDVEFLMVGRNVDSKNSEIMSMIDSSGLSSRFILLGERGDLPTIFPGLDIMANSSWTESFPNVTAEAMACGVPCVATDVGCAAELIGQTGFVVPPEDPFAMANAWQELIGMGKDNLNELGSKARERIKTKFNLLTVVGRYENLYSELLK